MELSNEFNVDVPVDEAWRVLTDLERIAPCMPGAALEEVEGDEYRGVVKVKVGPVTAQYRGKANFVERDPQAHRAVLRAEGRETRGQGNASATITATLEPSGGGTRVSVVTDLAITGRVAQIGRGVLADVSTKLLGQFVDSLESTVLAGAGATPEPAPSAEAPEAGGPDAAPAPSRRPRGKAAADGGDAAGTGSAGGGTAATPEDGAAASGALGNGAVGPQGVTDAGAQGAPGALRTIPQREVAPVDLLDLAGPSLAVRVLAPIAIVVVLLALWRRRRRRAG